MIALVIPEKVFAPWCWGQH